MKPVVINFPAPSPLGTHLIQLLGAEEGCFVVKTFPDGETYLRIEIPVEGREVIVNASLFHPDDKFLSLLFLSDALRAQKAKKLTLLAPYLPYMRQDKIFQPGEALTSRTFAHLISEYFDELITIDPHLHRYKDLNEIYSIPATVLHASPLLAQWIQQHVSDPFLIGPDAESAQWVRQVAGDFPYLVLNKVRHTDGHVEITWPQSVDIGKKTPVLVDDIISSGGTMVQAIEYLKELETKPPVCLAIHPLFAGEAYQNLIDAGAQKIVTCNTIPHPTNQIDVTSLIANIFP
jgi:ribose-phosphate pyrophosphokinase